MDKSTFTPHYGLLRVELLAMRRAAGLTQRQLAERLGREHSFVSRIELGARRLDLVEFFWVCGALGQDPEKATGRLLRRFLQLEGKRTAPRRPK